MNAITYVSGNQEISSGFIAQLKKFVMDMRGFAF